jgi:hypothetical protein
LRIAHRELAGWKVSNVVRMTLMVNVRNGGLFGTQIAGRVIITMPVAFALKIALVGLEMTDLNASNLLLMVVELVIPGNLVTQ